LRIVLQLSGRGVRTRQRLPRSPSAPCIVLVSRVKMRLQKRRTHLSPLCTISAHMGRELEIGSRICHKARSPLTNSPRHVKGGPLVLTSTSLHFSPASQSPCQWLQKSYKNISSSFPAPPLDLLERECTCSQSTSRASSRCHSSPSASRPLRWRAHLSSPAVAPLSRKSRSIGSVDGVRLY